MLSSKPAHQVKPGDFIHGISVLKVLHQGPVTGTPYPALQNGNILVPINCVAHGDEELSVAPKTLANVETKR